MFLGLLAIFASFWAAALVAMLGGKQFAVLTHLEGYRPAEFTVEQLVYFKGRYHGSKNMQPTRYYAEGTIEGHTESFGLGAYLPKIPASQEELEGMMQVGRVLPVLYNPGVKDTIGARVLYPDKDFPAKWLLRRNNLVKYGAGPMGIALALCLLCSFIDRSWLGVKFVLACIPFPLMGVIFSMLDLSA